MSSFSSSQAYGCLPGIHDQVLKAVDTLLKAAATEADSFINQATENLKEAKNYYRKATKNEEYYRQKLEEEAKILDKRNREVWLAEQRYNSSCQLDECRKSRLFSLFNRYEDLNNRSFRRLISDKNVDGLSMAPWCRFQIEMEQTACE